MKLILVFIVFFPLKSTLANQETSFVESFLSYFNNSVERENCDPILPTLNDCPLFLNQTSSQDQKSMIFSPVSAGSQCSRTSIKDFNTAGEFEAFLKNKEPFKSLSPLPQISNRCFSDSISHQKKNQLLAEYYNSAYRLESGLNKNLADISSIDGLLGMRPLEDIDCKGFLKLKNTKARCEELKACNTQNSSHASLQKSAQDTLLALQGISAIDRQLKLLRGKQLKAIRTSRGRETINNEIEELKKRKQNIEHLYPWIMGDKFKDGYDSKKKYTVSEISTLIKKQLEDTKEKLSENLSKTNKVYSCVIYNTECGETNEKDIRLGLAKAPSLDRKNIFRSKEAMSREDLSQLSSSERRSLKQDLIAESYFAGVQCREKIREDVRYVRNELKLLAFDVVLATATVGLGGAALAGRLAIRAGSKLAPNLTKAQRIQNLGLIGLDVGFTAPYAVEVFDQCEQDIDKLEQLAGSEEAKSCETQPLRLKHTSELKNCILMASLISLPITLPVAGVGLRAIVKAKPRPLPIKDPEDLAQAMSRGLHLNKGQDELFELYRKSYLGDYPVEHTLQDVLNILDDYPKLSNRLPIREQIIEFKTKSTLQHSEKLNQFLKSFQTSSANKRNNLFQIEANLGFWQKMLQFPPPDIKAGLNKVRIKELKSQHRQNFLSYLDTVVGKNVRQFMRDPSKDYKDKITILYKALHKQREKMIQENKEVSFISQAMVDLADTAGFGNSHYVKLIKSKNPVENMDGVRRILDQRDDTARELGFKDGFQELRQSLNVKPFQDAALQFSKIKQDTVNLASTESQNSLRLRALSVQEAPFRGCLGKDCATSSYFSKPLDPNYYIFTLTDAGNKSKGHITVVLGEALDSRKKKVKTAFVDKVQNVPNEQITPMLEGVRLSLKEHGYTLGIPKKLGEHNGLSNLEEIRGYVEHEILPQLENSLNSFKPHEHKYFFKSGYSRAHGELDMLEFEDSIMNRAEVSPGRIHSPSLADKDLNLNALYRPIFDLKDSNKAEDQIKFLKNLLDLIQPKYGFNLPANFLETYTRKLLSNKENPFKVRKQAFYTLTENKVFYIEDIQNNINKYFTPNEKRTIIGEMSNWAKSNSPTKQISIQTISHSVFVRTNIDELASILNSEWGKMLNINARLSAKSLDTPLMRAVRDNDINRAHLYKKHGADVNAEGGNAQTALSVAIEVENENMVEFLLENGAKVNMIHGNRNPPLMSVVEQGEINMLRSFIKHGADVNIRNIYGHNSLDRALKMKRFDMQRLLLKNGADVNSQVSGRSMLGRALFKHEITDIDAIRDLLESGASVYAKNPYGQTILEEAEEIGMAEDIIDLLRQYQ